MTGKISVLMGIYNCEDTLVSAVRSIQSQTYENWELILCDDGSADGTFALAEQLAKKDGRIVLLKNERNLGLNKTLNRCLATATGDFIARMDGDDESLLHRFETQIGFLHAHPEFQMVSSPMILFDETGEWGHTTVPENPKGADIVAGTAINHAPVMLRKSALETVGGYSEEEFTRRVEDVDLWIRMYAAGFRCHNIQQPLYRMRNDRNALNRRKYRYRIHSVRVRLRGCKLLGLGPISYLKAIRPMINGLVPAKLRQMIRKQQGNNYEENPFSDP